MSKPTHAQIQSALDRSMWNPDLMYDAGVLALTFAESEERGSQALYDYTHLAMVTALCTFIEDFFGEGSVDSIIDDHVDEELALILSEGTGNE